MSREKKFTQIYSAIFGIGWQLIPGGAAFTETMNQPLV